MSRNALAAIVFVRVFCADDNARVILVSAKIKVAPLKRMTIPRLELSAAVFLVRFILKVCEVLEYHHVPIHLWTDSTVDSYMDQKPSITMERFRTKPRIIHTRTFKL